MFGELLISESREVVRKRGMGPHGLDGFGNVVGTPRGAGFTMSLRNGALKKTSKTRFYNEPAATEVF